MPRFGDAGLPRLRGLLFVVFFDLCEDLVAPVETVRRDAVTQMRFTRGRIDRQRRGSQFVVRATHTTPCGCLATLLYSHFILR